MKFQFLVLMFLLGSCASVQSKDYSLIFVHGAHFSSDSFDPLLEEYYGESAYAVDLPNGPATASKITLTDYSIKVCDELKQLRGQSILIGHSQGGAVINHALGICPEKVKALIYIAATIPFPEEKPFALFGAQDDIYYFKAIEENKEKGLFMIKDPKAFLEAFIQDGDSSQRLMVERLAQDEPIHPASTIMKFDLSKFASIKKLVLITTSDRVISMLTQKTYAKRIANATISYLESGHLPMITQKKDLYKEIQAFLKTL